MKALFTLMLVIFLFGCQGSRQKIIQTICKEMGKNTANCTKTVGMISASVVENQFRNNTASQTLLLEKPSLLHLEDSFSW